MCKYFHPHGSCLMEMLVILKFFMWKYFLQKCQQTKIIQHENKANYGITHKHMQLLTLR